MTTANLVISNLTPKRKSYVLRKWSDGYDVGEFLKTILEGWKSDGFEFSLESLKETLESETGNPESDFDFEMVCENETDGCFETGFETIYTDWTWSCVLLNEKEALITGSNGSKFEIWKV